MATGEGITPGADITMRTTLATQPPVGASIDPTNYYGQSFQYDEWVKSKIKELNQKPEETELDRMRVQQIDNAAAAEPIKNDYKKELDELTPILNAKTDKFTKDNYAAINPMMAYLADQQQHKQKMQETANAKAIIMQDKQILGALGYDPDTNYQRRYGSVEPWQVYSLVAKKYPELAKYWPDHQISATQDWASRTPTDYADEGTPISQLVGGPGPAINQLDAFTNNVRIQKGIAETALDNMKKSYTTQDYDNAKNKYESAVKELHNLANKVNIADIKIYAAPPVVEQGKGDQSLQVDRATGKTVNVANEQYTLANLAAGQRQTAANLSASAANILKGGGKVTAEQVNDIAVNNANSELNSYKVKYMADAATQKVDRDQAIKDWQNNPTDANLATANAAYQKYANTSYMLNELPNITGSPNIKNTMDAITSNLPKDSGITIDVNKIIGQSSNIPGFTNNTDVPKNAAPSGSVLIGGQKFNTYNTNSGEVMATGVDNKTFTPLKNVNELVQKFNLTGDYNLNYGRYSVGNPYSRSTGNDSNREEITNRTQSNEIANIESEKAGNELLKAGINVNFSDKFASLPPISHTSVLYGNLPIVQKDGIEYVIPKTGSPLPLKIYDTKTPAEKSVMGKTLIENAAQSLNLDPLGIGKLQVIGHTSIADGGLSIVNSKNGSYVIARTGMPIPISDFNKMSSDDKYKTATITLDDITQTTMPQAQKDILNASTKYGGNLSTNYIDTIKLSGILDTAAKNNGYDFDQYRSKLPMGVYNNIIDKFAQSSVTKDDSHLADQINDIIKPYRDKLIDIPAGYMLIEDKDYNGTVVPSYTTETSKLPDANNPFDVKSPFKTNQQTNNNDQQTSVYRSPNIKPVSNNPFNVQSPFDNQTSKYKPPDVKVVDVISATKNSSPTQTGLTSVLVGVGKVSNMRLPLVNLNWNSLSGSKKKVGGETFRKTKGGKPKVDIKKTSSKKDKKQLDINTLVKSEIPDLHISELNFIRGKTANNKVGVINIDLITGNKLFKIPLISLNKKKKVNK